MTRKHFEALAESIKNLPAKERGPFAMTLIPMLSGLNPRFDCVRFLAACAVDLSGKGI